MGIISNSISRNHFKTYENSWKHSKRRSQKDLMSYLIFYQSISLNDIIFTLSVFNINLFYYEIILNYGIK